MFTVNIELCGFGQSQSVTGTIFQLSDLPSFIVYHPLCLKRSVLLQYSIWVLTRDEMNE